MKDGGSVVSKLYFDAERALKTDISARRQTCRDSSLSRTAEIPQKPHKNTLFKINVGFWEKAGFEIRLAKTGLLPGD